MNKRLLIFLTLIITSGLAMTFISNTNVSQTQMQTFDFSGFSQQMLSPEQLDTYALRGLESTVEITHITEQITRLVPKGEWFETLGVGATSLMGHPDEPVYVLAVRGEFRYRSHVIPTSTIAIDGITGMVITYTGQFIDPNLITDLNIRAFQPSVTLPIESAPPAEQTRIFEIQNQGSSSLNDLQITPTP